MSKIYTKLNIGNTVASVGSKCFKRLSTEDPLDTLAAGLYDADNNLVASWDTLVNTYGMDCEKDYTSSTYKTDTASPYYVLTNNSELANGVKLVIDDGVTSIGSVAFYGCSNLTDIKLGKSITEISSWMKSAGASYGIFSYCTSLTNVTIPDSVTSIGGYVFLGCTSLTNVNFGENSQLTSIGQGAFYACKSLTSITIPDSVTSIGSEAFKSCTSLASITIPDSVTIIGSEAFNYCTALTNASIPDSVTIIGDSAFYDCTSLISASIPDSVTIIGGSAFYGCTSLISASIPESITSIGANSFPTQVCTKYSNAYYIGSPENPYFALIRDSSSDITYCTIHSATKFIASGAFQNCKSLSSVTIGKSVTNIGDKAFYQCKALKKITIPNGVLHIGSSAFAWCAFTNITSTTLPDSITEIRSGTFQGNDITSVVIPDSVTSIGSSAFDNNPAIDVTLPAGLTSMGNGIFWKVSSVTFKGTIAQWNAMERGDSWYYYKLATYVTCSDGTVAI